MTTGESDADNKSYIATGSGWKKSHEVPGGRPGHERDMAQLAIMLAANNYIQGEVVRIVRRRVVARSLFTPAGRWPPADQRLMTAMIHCIDLYIARANLSVPSAATGRASATGSLATASA